MLPNCHLCVVIGSSPVAFYFFVCTCCGLLVVCAWCACRDAIGGEYRLHGSPRSERAAPRRNSSRRDVSIRLDEIRRAKIVSRSLATAKVITAAMKIPMDSPEEDPPRRSTRTAATTDSPRASPESSSPHAVTLVLTDEERGPESAPEDRSTDGTSVWSQSRVLYWIRLDGKWMRARSARNHTKKTTSSRTRRNRGAGIIFIRSAYRLG